jgi:hypothetical protein
MEPASLMPSREMRLSVDKTDDGHRRALVVQVKNTP